MSEVEKLYELAGIEKIKDCLYCKEREIECLKSILRIENCGKEPYGNYPPFTVEKQLELIKWLGSIKDYIVEIDKFKGVYYVGCREAGSNNKHWGSHNLFEEALAELTNDLWQSLTETEQEEIRKILKG